MVHHFRKPTLSYNMQQVHVLYTKSICEMAAGDQHRDAIKDD